MLLSQLDYPRKTEGPDSVIDVSNGFTTSATLANPVQLHLCSPKSSHSLPSHAPASSSGFTEPHTSLPGSSQHLIADSLQLLRAHSYRHDHHFNTKAAAACSLHTTTAVTGSSQSTMSASAASRVFAIPELLEQILLSCPEPGRYKCEDCGIHHSHNLHMLRLQRVSKAFHCCIVRSSTLQRFIYAGTLVAKATESVDQVVHTLYWGSHHWKPMFACLLRSTYTPMNDEHAEYRTRILYFEPKLGSDHRGCAYLSASWRRVELKCFGFTKQIHLLFRAYALRNGGIVSSHREMLVDGSTTLGQLRDLYDEAISEAWRVW